LQIGRPAVLGDKKGGRFQICVDSNVVRRKQFFRPSTNVFVTRFLMENGIAELEDFMAVGLPTESSGYRRIYRWIPFACEVHCAFPFCRSDASSRRENH
jgi:hypothetical protein